MGPAGVQVAAQAAAMLSTIGATTPELPSRHAAGIRVRGGPAASLVVEPERQPSASAVPWPLGDQQP